MAALNFVAVEDGLEEDPKLIALGRMLRVSRPMAVYFVVRLQRLILRRGNHLLGSLPKTFTADDVAGFLEFEGSPRRLIDALRKQGFLRFKKGRGFYFPAWKDSITGRYACRREEDRLWHERKRQTGRSAYELSSHDVGRQSADAASERPTTSERIETGRNERSNSELPPDPPPAGGASVEDERWTWLEQHAPTPQDRDACKRILARMKQEDWALVQRAYLLRTDPGASISRKNRRALEWPTDQFLRKQGFLRFVGSRRPGRTVPRARHSEPTPLGEIEQRQKDGDAFLLDLLRDPDVPEAKKLEARSRWLADPQHHGKVPPWEVVTERAVAP